MATRKLKMEDRTKQLDEATQEVRKATQTEDVHALIDAGYELNEIKKTCEELLTDIKAKVKTHAQENKVKQVQGQSGRTVAKISPSTKTTIDPKGALGVLKKMKRLDMFGAVFKVGVTDFKKYFGEPAEDIAKTEVNEYGSVGFSEKRRR